MRKFYEIFSNQKLNALRSKLSWTNYRELLSLVNIDEIIYYINICEKQSLTHRQLKEKIKSKEYEILPNEFGERYSKRNLWLMLKFYELSKKMQAAPAQLSWSHYCELLQLI